MADPRDFWHILPKYVKQDVIHYLDFWTRARLSWCSKSDRALVRSVPVVFDNVIRVTDPSSPDFRFRAMNCPAYWLNEIKSTEENAKCLVKMLGAPNKIRHLCLYGSPRDVTHEEVDRLVDELQVRDIHMKVRTLMWGYTAGDVFLKFFTRIDTEYLEGLMMFSPGETDEHIERIVATEQWKKLKLVFKGDNPRSALWLEAILEKPYFHFDAGDMSAEEARRVVKAFQDKNHPVDSCFVLSFTPHFLNVRDLYPTCNLALSNNHTLYEKMFPHADEELELRVQMMPGSDSISEIEKIHGIVVRKDATHRYEGALERIQHLLYRTY